MCGIVAVYSDGRISGERIAQTESAIQQIRHRGPDHQRVMRFERAALAHARLAVVDLSERANQPFTSRDGRYSLVWNGEIYNYTELREALRARGVAIHGDSDTEVLLHSFIEWGEACLRKLNGMWALAIYDSHRHELFLARDRFGIKPLYWRRVGAEAFVASELKAFFPFGLPMQVQWHHMTPYPLHSAADPPSAQTIFEAVNELPAGTFLRIGAARDAHPQRYWRLEEERVDVPARFDERVEQLRGLLMDAVQLRTRNDVPTALALSGGMDSSSIYGACQAMRASGWSPRTATSGEPKRLQAFTAEYPGEACDESRYALACGEHWRDPHGITCIRPDVDDFPRLLEELVWHQEFPVWSPVAAAYHAFYREVAAAGHRIILEGHGADEMFGGYLELARAAYRTYWGEGRVRDSWSALRCAVGLQHPDVADSLPRLAYFGFRRARRSIKRRLRARPAGGRHSPDALLRDGIGAWGSIPAKWMPPLSRALHDAFTHHPQPMFLRVFDRATMAHGLESAAPFLDHRIVRYVFSLPDSDKVLGQTKRILRRAACGWLPESVRQRRSKQGFSAPLRQWFNRPDMRDYLEDSFRSTRASRSECVDAGKAVAFLEGKRGRSLEGADIELLWPALNLHLWEQQFAGKDPAPAAERAATVGSAPGSRTRAVGTRG